MLTCEPAFTVVVPPALALTRSVPSSARNVVWVVPSARRSTIVWKAVPRTAAVELGVRTSNFESGVLSFCTDAQLRPRVCSMVTWRPSPATRLRLTTRTCDPGSIASEEPSKNVRTARPLSFDFTTSPFAKTSPSSAGANAAPLRDPSIAVLTTASVAAFVLATDAPRGK